LSLPFERIFSMAAFDALRTYRKQIAATPALGQDEMLRLAGSLVADAAGLDFVAATEIHPVVVTVAPHESASEFYRQCIFDIVLAQKMGWGRIITLGRRRFYGSLKRDEQACFRAAKLMEEPPTADVVEWWDRLELAMRAANDGAKKERSRVAEKLTFDREVAKVAALGIAESPRWVAIDDNTVGYDVLSFTLGQDGPVNLLIEVKSTLASPLRFYVSRNEWQRAVEFGDAYVFHIWNLAAEPPQLYVRTKAQVEPHIPADQEKGEWINAIIPVSVG
jgi:hypothetical protein